jgi:hypothetical protein
LAVASEEHSLDNLAMWIWQFGKVQLANKETLLGKIAE